MGIRILARSLRIVEILETIKTGSVDRAQRIGVARSIESKRPVRVLGLTCRRILIEQVGSVDAIRVLDVTFGVKAGHQTKRGTLKPITTVVVLVESVTVPALVFKTSTGIGIAESQLGAAPLIVAAAVDAVRAVLGIPCGPAVISDVVVVERCSVVVRICRLVGHQTNDRTLLDEDSVRLVRLVRVIGKVQLGRTDDAPMHVPIGLIRARWVLAVLEYPHLVGRVVAVVAEDVHIRQARRLVVVVLVGGIQLGELRVCANLTLAVAGIHKIQTGGRRITAIGREFSSLVVATVVGVQNLKISFRIAIGHLKVRVVLHGEVRVERRVGGQAQHRRGAVQRHVQRLRLVLVLRDHHGAELLGRAVQRGHLHAGFRFGGRLRGGAGGDQRVTRGDCGGQLAIRHVQRPPLVGESEVQRGHVEHVAALLLGFGVVLNGLPLRLAFVEHVHGHRQIAGRGVHHHVGRRGFGVGHRGGAPHRHVDGVLVVPVGQRLVKRHRIGGFLDLTGRSPRLLGLRRRGRRRWNRIGLRGRLRRGGGRVQADRRHQCRYCWA